MAGLSFHGAGGNGVKRRSVRIIPLYASVVDFVCMRATNAVVDAARDDDERVEKCIRELGEHFDTVQIFCTRHEFGTDHGTVAIVHGSGNWYARVGQVGRWMAQMDEEARIEERTDAE